MSCGYYGNDRGGTEGARLALVVADWADWGDVIIGDGLALGQAYTKVTIARHESIQSQPSSIDRTLPFPVRGDRLELENALVKEIHYGESNFEL